jgi:hypothetical protein
LQALAVQGLEGLKLHVLADEVGACRLQLVNLKQQEQLLGVAREKDLKSLSR